MPKRICATCGNTQGPFQFSDIGNSYTCTPVMFEKETGRLIGRVATCNDRRKKLELEWYGPEHKELELFKLTQE